MLIFSQKIFLNNLHFKKNEGNYGAAIYIDNCQQVSLKNTNFEENFAHNQGGALYVRNEFTKNINITNCKFTENESK